MIITRRSATAFLALQTIAPLLRAQSGFPSKTVQMISPSSSGSVTDLIGRIFSERLSKQIGQTVIIQNRPGAGSVIGTQALVNAPADGYALMLTNSAHAINPAVIPNLPYDTAKDFATLAIVGEAPSVLFATKTMGVKTVAEFVALAKQKPGFINYASAGNGSQSHLAGAAFAAQAGIEMTHVPYKNVPEIIPDMIEGRVQACFSTPGFLMQQARSGTLLALGASTAEDMVDPIPVLSVRKHSGINYDYSVWYAIFTSAKTPKPIQEYWSAQILQALDDPAVKEKLAVQALAPRRITLAEADDYVRRDVEKQRILVNSTSARKN